MGLIDGQGRAVPSRISPDVDLVVVSRLGGDLPLAPRWDEVESVVKSDAVAGGLPLTVSGIAEWVWWYEDHFATSEDYSRFLDLAVAENAISRADRVEFAARSAFEGVVAVRACLVAAPRRRTCDAIAVPDNGVLGYLHSRADDQLSIVAEDGFAYDAEAFHDMMVESAMAATVEALGVATVDVEVLSVSDTEIGHDGVRAVSPVAGDAI